MQGFTGWLKSPGGAWRPVVRDVDEGRCWQKLLDVGRGGSRMVLPADRHPDDPPAAAPHDRRLRKF